MNKYLKTLALALIAIVASCKKTDLHAVAMVDKNDILITTPFEQQVFKSGDTVYINGSINTKTEIHGYEINLAKSNGDVIHTYSEHSHGTEIHINDYWVNTMTGNNDIILSISAVVDHDGAELSNSITFRTQ